MTARRLVLLDGVGADARHQPADHACANAVRLPLYLRHDDASRLRNISAACSSSTIVFGAAGELLGEVAHALRLAVGHEAVAFDRALALARRIREQLTGREGFGRRTTPAPWLAAAHDSPPFASISRITR